MPDGAMPSRRAGSVQRGVVNPANIVTAGRLCAVPVAIMLVLRQELGWAAALFALAGLSDALDGWLARRLGGSALGAALDPVADKALVLGMLVTLAVTGVLPGWLAVVVLVRDSVIVLGVLMLWVRNSVQNRPAVRIAPVFVSKLNTALQLLLVGLALVLSAMGQPAALLLSALGWLVAGTTVLSGAATVRQAFR